MSYTQDLVRTYSEAHKKLIGGIPETKKYIPPSPAINKLPKKPKRPLPILPRPRTVPVAFIVWLICHNEHIPEGQFVGKSKVQKICLCRQLFYYLAQLYTPHSIAEIGKKIGKDHTTVSYGIKAVRLRIETVPGWRECVASYREELNKYLGTAGKTHLSCPLCGR